MLKEIRKYLNSKFPNGEVNISWLYFLIFLSMFTNFLDAFSTQLVLINGGNEVNTIIGNLYNKSYFLYYYLKVVVFPLFFYVIVVLSSNLYFYIFQNNKGADDFIIYSMLVFSGVYFVAFMWNIGVWISLL